MKKRKMEHGSGFSSSERQSYHARRLGRLDIKSRIQIGNWKSTIDSERLVSADFFLLDSGSLVLEILILGALDEALDGTLDTALALDMKTDRSKGNRYLSDNRRKKPREMLGGSA